MVEVREGIEGVHTSMSRTRLCLSYRCAAGEHGRCTGVVAVTHYDERGAIPGEVVCRPCGCQEFGCDCKDATRAMVEDAARRVRERARLTW